MEGCFTETRGRFIRMAIDDVGVRNGIGSSFFGSVVVSRYAGSGIIRWFPRL